MLSEAIQKFEKKFFCFFLAKKKTIGIYSEKCKPCIGKTNILKVQVKQKLFFCKLNNCKANNSNVRTTYNAPQNVIKYTY